MLTSHTPQFLNFSTVLVPANLESQASHMATHEFCVFVTHWEFVLFFAVSKEESMRTAVGRALDAYLKSKSKFKNCVEIQLL